ncbi:efflux transporter outer membrane subunit [Rhodoferax sp.]|uniref:efflux transporter outer membrane subunit n=1 Tax=Rhodoferax sp. TaxID=50421 RepID=UPI00284F1C4B|nr:efflux transporter outer membrane subunit [Rhodoferax sp.]MDR3370945.1 efflux transporter outer membrane subunit [Rhodoferax sp.]
MFIRLVFLGVCSAALCACGSVAPAGHASLDFEVPASWSQTQPTEGQVNLVNWWQRFDDPLLSRLITQARVSNTSVRGAEAALKQARALRDVADASLWPSVSSSASAGRNRNGDYTSNSFQVGLDASWEMDIFGGNRASVRAADASAQASAATLADVQVSLAAEVALDYISLRSAQERLSIAQANLISQQETLQITDWRLQAGLVTSLELEQARALTEQTAAQVPTLQTTIAQVSHALSVLTGQPPVALATTLAAVVAVPQVSGDWALTFPAETLRQRSDVRAAEFQVSAAAARVTQADAARLPNFKLGGSLGLNALTLGALTDGASVAASVLASLSVPVFDAGAAQAQLRAQQAAMDQANTEYQAAVLTALTEVEDALVALQGDRNRLLRLQNAYQSADIAATLARQRYGSGLVDFQTVLETQRTRLSTQDSVAVARAAVSADHVRLVKALGGGWMPAAGTATSLVNPDSPRTPAP